MKIHHTKHQKKYFDKMMEVLDAKPSLMKKTIIELMSDVDSIPTKDREKFKNNAGGYFNHSFFWNVMTAEKTSYNGEIKKLIDKKFNSLDEFKKEFIQTGMDHFGSGWVWLCTEDGKDIKLSSMVNQNNPYIEGCGKPLIGCDLWEHAYYLKYQNDREKYLNKWFDLINWDFVNETLESYK
jgi:Fe-Mn family superoxide dismutase